MPRIKMLLAREILDSRGFPTVEVEVQLESGKSAYASVPSGASTGSLEALELRDNNPKRYMGKGVQKALQNVLEVIAPEIKNHLFESQAELDNLLLKLDGTPNKSKLGANALLAVSLAYAKACAQEAQQSLSNYLAHLSQGTPCMPVPMMNILNGGAHADNTVDIQEFMILPVGAKDWPEAVRMGTEVYHALKSVLKAAHLSTTVGDEGGFAPNLKSNQEALDKIMAAIEKAGFIPGREIYLGLDVAANELYQNNHYVLEAEGSSLSASKLIDKYEAWINTYPILSIEDGMAENDVVGWQEITKRLGKRIQLVGDDVFVTNPKLLSQGIKSNIANAILIKLNQIGTLTETLETIQLAKQNQYQTIISHRSGETEETFISDLAVGCGAQQIKTGAPARTDRVAKYNQLTRIYQSQSLPYVGSSAFRKWIQS